MSMIRVVGALIVALALAGPANAADFTGPTLFVAAAYQNVELDAARVNAGREGAGRVRGVVGAGYDIRVIDRLIAGVAVSAAFGDEQVCAATARSRYCADVGTEISALVRAGYVVAPKLMLFGEAGYATAPGRLTYTNALVPRRNSIKSGDLSGMQLGLGAEIALTRRSYARVNYRYTNFWCGIEERQLLAGVGIRF